MVPWVPLSPVGPAAQEGPAYPGSLGCPLVLVSLQSKNSSLASHPARKARALAHKSVSPCSHFFVHSVLCLLTPPLGCPTGILNLTQSKWTSTSPSLVMNHQSPVHSSQNLESSYRLPCFHNPLIQSVTSSSTFYLFHIS